MYLELSLALVLTRLSPWLVLQRVNVELVRGLPVHSADLFELLDCELSFLLPGPWYLPHRLVQTKRLVRGFHVLDLLLIDVDRHEIFVVRIFILVIILAASAFRLAGIIIIISRTICGNGMLRFFYCGNL